MNVERNLDFVCGSGRGNVIPLQFRIAVDWNEIECFDAD